MRNWGPIDNSHKIPFAQSLNNFAKARNEDFQQGMPKSIPCTISEVISAGVVKVNFEVNSVNQFPNVTMPVSKHSAIQFPLSVGDIGLAISGEVRHGALTGLGSGTPNLTDTTPNLSSMMFVPLGKSSDVFLDKTATSLISQNGAINLQVGNNGVAVNGSLSTSGNLIAGNGASGTFLSQDNKTITVENGIITKIT